MSTDTSDAPPRESAPARAGARLIAVLPRGQALPDRAWRRRHHALLALLWLHVPALFAYGVLRGHGLGRVTLEVSIIAALAALATVVRDRRVAASLVGFGLMGSAAIAVHLSGGASDVHLYFFVILALVALYEDWVPFLVAIGCVLLYHGIAGSIDSGVIYDQQDAIAHPWKWAGIHAGLLAAAGAAAVVAWRLNEESRSEASEAYRRARDSERSMGDAQQLARVGSWEFDLDADRITWSLEMYRILGLDPDRHQPSVDLYESLVPHEFAVEGHLRLQRTIAKAARSASSTRCCVRMAGGRCTRAVS